jgi:hypothetical protein
MFTAGASSRTTSRVERHGRRAIRMRPILATAAVAAAVVSAIAITPPAFARINTGGGAHLSGPNSGGPRQPSYTSTRAPNANVPGAHHLNGAGSAQQFSSSGVREGSHNGSTPPGWTGHGEKRGWDGGKTPPGLSHRDGDPEWRDRKFDRGDERGDRERAQFHTGQLARGGGVGDLAYARKPQ